MARCEPPRGCMPLQPYLATAAAAKALEAERQTEVHFRKCRGIMNEILKEEDNFPKALPQNFRFLDLACAPGGFCSVLLEDPREPLGFAVSLPTARGGFPMRLRSDRLFVQQADLFDLATSPESLLATDVHLAVCDAQYMRDEVAWDAHYLGQRLKSNQHGVWALLCLQLLLGCGKLEQGGALIFRFAWWDGGMADPSTTWYKLNTFRLFAVLHTIFTSVRAVKSAIYNAKTPSFYVSCAGFRRDSWVRHNVLAMLRGAFEEATWSCTPQYQSLNLLAAADALRTTENDDRVSRMLDHVDKVRCAHVGSKFARGSSNGVATDEVDPAAVCVVEMPSEGLALKELTGVLSRYGALRRVEPLPDSAEAAPETMANDGVRRTWITAQFATAAHARACVAGAPREAFLQGCRCSLLSAAPRWVVAAVLEEGKDGGGKSGAQNEGALICDTSEAI
eukprot:TRINITY_DN31572_c0_g1_i1.p1 TRINITY_DN31572_c0_g1~~TRINITY_DN31572_c0_g1_i1.p1  ORF type:complete len:472 (+),score=88.40 TRINITY_DN31572_c0_g1_i1:68-1417(+)